MLDEEFSRLLLRTWQISAETVEEYGGIVCQSSATLLLGYFLSTGDVDQNPLNAIQCALELKRKMCDLGREWKIRKSWLHDIELNMGIHAGHEFMASANSALGNHLLALGETVEVANWLSKIASNGQIWTTKAVIQRVPEEELNQLRFGIFRSDGHRQVFIARCFSRIKDLSTIGGAGPLPDTEMAAQSVT
jgi:class 3 adenylate cyclase